MSEQKNRSIDIIMDDLQRINQEFREKVRDALKEPDPFIKLSEIEKMGRELSHHTQKLYLEQTESLLNDIDERLLMCKKIEYLSAAGCALWTKRAGNSFLKRKA